VVEHELSIRDVAEPDDPQRHGDEVRGAHPVHGSSTGQNFTINPVKNTWHCFRHRTGGGPLELIAIQEGLIDCDECEGGVLRGERFSEVVQLANEKYGTDINIENLDQDELQRQELVKEVLQKAVNLAAGQLTDKQQNRIQEKRALSEETIRDVRIGYFNKTVDQTLRKRFSNEALVDSGLYSTSKENDDIYPVLRSRIIVPYMQYGRPYFIIGRRTQEQEDYWLEQAKENESEIQEILGNEDNEVETWEEAEWNWVRGKSPKYKKTRQTDYNRHILWQQIDHSESQIAITEGIYDAVSVAQAGCNVVSPITTRFREDDIQKVVKNVEKFETVYIAMDMDAGGQEGAESTARELVRSGADPYIVSLPEGMDMDDWTTENGYDIEDLLDEAESYIDICIERIEDADDRNRRNQELESLLHLIEDWDDVQRAAVLEELPVDQSVLESRMQEVERGSLSFKDQSHRATGQHRDYFFNKDSKFIPKWLSDRLLHDHSFLTMRDNEEVYVYLEGVYRPYGKRYIKQWSTSLLEEDTRQNHINEVTHYIQANTYIDRGSLNNKPYLLNLKNGIFDLKRKELYNHDPRLKTTIQLPLTYNPNAECPEFKAFVDEIVDGDDKQLVQEMFGYCLLKQYELEEAFMLIGDGSNGKSTLLNVLEKLLGGKNTSNELLQNLEEKRFSTAELHGKLANIAADLPDRKLQSTGIFKMLTGGDSVTAERKHQEPFQFHNFATLIFSANSIPDSRDDTDAFYRRWNIINFPYQFTSDPDDGNPDADPDIFEKITTQEEMQGIFNWAIDGLQRVLENDRFSSSSGMDETRRKMQRFQSSIGAFVQDRVEPDSGNYVTKEQFYNQYREYCQEKGMPVKANEVVGRKLPTYISVETARPRIAGRRQTAWKGVKLVSKTESESVEEVDEKLKDAIKRLCEDVIGFEELVDKVEASDDDVEELIQQMKNDGTLFNPKPGQLKVL
jgi:P4 family phage/plasmid primase-like protien